MTKRFAIAFVFAWVMFHRLDGHALWIITDKVETIEGAGQLGYPTGTLITTGSGHARTVKENVDEVVRAIRDAK